MSNLFFENKTFEKIDYSKDFLKIGEYYNCTFLNCNFQNSNLAEVNFTECKFRDCNISMAKIQNAVFAEAIFENCKLTGLSFNDCNQFIISFSFKDCSLDLCSFYKLKIPKTKFKNCNLQETDFVSSDLKGSLFDNCNLRGAVFENSIVEKVDFVSSYNYSINPEVNKVKGAKFSLQGVVALLDKYKIIIE